MKVNLNLPEMQIDIKPPKKNINLGIQRITTGGGGVRQIYRGPDKPTDPNILIWIDTSKKPVTGTQLITHDNLEFITADNEAFILHDEIIEYLLTNDNKEFIDANNKNFVLREEI